MLLQYSIFLMRKYPTMVGNTNVLWKPTEPTLKSDDVTSQLTLTMMKMNLSTIIRCPIKILYGGIVHYFIK